MKVVEKNMVEALNTNSNYKCGNTEVRDGSVYLFGNHIATKVGDDVIPNLATLTNWPTRTTQSRLRALGVDVYQRDYNTYVDGVML